MPVTEPLLIHGMHGLGDNIHQRAIVRAFLVQDFNVTLETSWPCIYHDLPIKFVRRPVALRTQLKNAEREKDKFIPSPLPHHKPRSVHVSYNRTTVMCLPSRTILEAMFRSAGIQDQYVDADYRLPIPDPWAAQAHILASDWKTGGKPIMIYRPLVERPEYRGAKIRNANPAAYAELVALARDSFYVVSVADLEENREWIVGPRLIPDKTYHHGELDFETLAAVTAKSQLVFTSSGFAAILGPAVGVPTISIQGGYEPAVWHSDGAKFAPYLGIDPIDPCICASSGCSKMCSKAIDMPRAKAAIAEFSAKLGISTAAETRSFGEMFIPAPPAPEPTYRVAPRKYPQVRVGHPSLLARRNLIR